MTTLAEKTGSSVSLGMTLPIALILHALVILGLGFAIDLSTKSSRSTLLDITLVNIHSDTMPKKADIIAQVNLHASGDTSIKNRARSTMVSDNIHLEDDISPIKASQSSPNKPPVLQPMILTTKGETFKRAPKISEQPKQEEQRPDDKLSNETKLEARLMAELAEDEANYAEIPKVRYLNSSNTKSAVEAEYIDAWAKKIERIGTTNFPEEAISRNKNGQLIITATINPNGRIHMVKIKTPSGIRLLDRAAIRIVKIAAPYPPLPKKVKQEYDQLNITRTFLFDTGLKNRLRTQ